MAPRVLIGTSSFAALDDQPRALARSAGLELVDNPHKRRLSREEIKELLVDDIVGLLAGLEPLDAEVIAASKLKVISRVGAGMDNVDQEAAKAAGIAVFNTPYGPTQAVAELTLGCLLNVLRRVREMDADLHSGTWSKIIGGQLHGKCVAIVGYGRIGRRLAELLAPFQPTILVVDPFLGDDFELEHERCSLKEALLRADVVSLHLSGDKLLLDGDRIGAMKYGAIVLNAARGGLVDDTALAAALQSGHLAGAWIDAFPDEPYKGPLQDCPTALLTPHVASYTRECRLGMEAEAVENLICGLRKAGVID